MSLAGNQRATTGLHFQNSHFVQDGLLLCACFVVTVCVTIVKFDAAVGTSPLLYSSCSNVIWCEKKVVTAAQFTVFSGSVES